MLCQKLNAQVPIVLGSEAFVKCSGWEGVWGWGPHDGVSDFIERNKSSSLLCHNIQPLLGGNADARTIILNCPASSAWAKKPRTFISYSLHDIFVIATESKNRPAPLTQAQKIPKDLSRLKLWDSRSIWGDPCPRGVLKNVFILLFHDTVP